MSLCLNCMRIKGGRLFVNFVGLFLISILSHKIKVRSLWNKPKPFFFISMPNLPANIFNSLG